FGVSNHEEKGGILHFREYPDTECTEHCVGCTPVLYEAEVIYVPYYGDPLYYVPQALSLTYIPPGRYIVIMGGTQYEEKGSRLLIIRTDRGRLLFSIEDVEGSS
ncbi:MAG: hypothetical protein WBA22_02535, partial [Candidatus Methanofastidiosia archaeon]